MRRAIFEFLSAPAFLWVHFVAWLVGGEFLVVPVDEDITDDKPLPGS